MLVQHSSSDAKEVIVKRKNVRVKPPTTMSSVKEVRRSNSMYPPENAEEFSSRFFFSVIFIFNKNVRHRRSRGKQWREKSKITQRDIFR